MKLFAPISLPLFLLDQWTKWLVRTNLELYSGLTVIPGFFDLVYVTNTGAAFGSFKDRNWFFVVLSIVTLAVLIVFYVRGAFRDVWGRWGLALLAGGILGNLTDRILHQHVIDFLYFYVGENHWPAFNVADSCICVASALFMIHTFRENRRATQARDSDQPALS